MKKHKLLFVTAVLLAVLAALCGCSSSGDDNSSEQGIKVYCTDRQNSRLAYEVYYPESTETEAVVAEILERIEAFPEDPELRPVKPSDVYFEEFSFGTDGQLIIDFSSSYLKMTSIDEVLTRAAVVKTLCQIPGVEAVEFQIGGLPVILRGDTPLGQMTSSDFIDNTGGMTLFNQTTQLTLFFAEKGSDLMQEIIITAENEGNKTIEQLTVEALIAGPPEYEPGLLSVMPEGTVLNKITTKDGICYVDFNEHFLDIREGVSDENAIYCLVNSLCDIPHINKVRITVDGEKRSFIGAYKLPESLERRPELIGTEKAGELSAVN